MTYLLSPAKCWYKSSHLTAPFLADYSTFSWDHRPLYQFLVKGGIPPSLKTTHCPLPQHTYCKEFFPVFTELPTGYPCWLSYLLITLPPSTTHSHATVDLLENFFSAAAVCQSWLPSSWCLRKFYVRSDGNLFYSRPLCRGLLRTAVIKLSPEGFLFRKWIFLSGMISSQSSFRNSEAWNHDQRILFGLKFPPYIYSRKSKILISSAT